MTEAFATQLRSVTDECRKVEKDFVLGFEEPNERFNHLVGIQDYRDCETPDEPASIFNYLYHEFLPTFQSNPHKGDRFLTAYCLVNGQIPHFVPSMHMGGNVIFNGDFEQWAPNRFLGWEQVKEYKGVIYSGMFHRDVVEKHSGAASLRLENASDSDIVQISQNVHVGEGLEVGKRYRLSAWMKTAHMARSNAINLGVYCADGKWRGIGHIPMPTDDKGWTQGSAEFTLPKGALLLRIMIHVVGKAKVWVDDVLLEEVRSDGSLVPAVWPDTPADHKMMKRWVELFHGEGRPYLLFGRMLHLPPLRCETLMWRERQVPAVLYNAFCAPDGTEAVILANATGQRQKANLFWKRQEMTIELDPDDAQLIRAQ